jgi:soluble lytic murein transglycosylase
LKSLTAILLAAALLLPAGLGADTSPEQQRRQFMDAWAAARTGDRDAFEQGLDGLQDYLLFPYLQYEDYRHRRARVDVQEMAGFLDSHRDWAFTAGLETAWLRTLGERGKWGAVLQYGGNSGDTEVRCHHARARIRQGQTDGVLQEARALWAAGKSQPDACDPVFAWLSKQPEGITPGLAWERIRLAMDAREVRLTRYIARYLPAQDQAWAERWYQQDRSGYRQLKQALKWPAGERSREISSYGLRRLARNDPDRAWEIFQALVKQQAWPAVEQGRILKELALWSAVDDADGTSERMQAVPAEYRDERLLEWWTRFAIRRADWAAVNEAISMMPAELADDSRWRYWSARAAAEQGAEESSRRQFAELAEQANFYGFLAADRLELPYSICPVQPEVEDGASQALARQPGFERSLELHRAEMPNWARREWNRAVAGMDKQGLRAAAALAVEENWPDRAIYALGNTGDLRWYEWRFPTGYSGLVEPRAKTLDLDISWVMGLMRSESAMAEDAISPAGARGLMQVTPGTARQLAKKHSIAYQGRQQLLQAEQNIRFGTAYLRDLLDRFEQNPVLASAAYNAGPHVVDRWLKEDPVADPAAWIETLPYYETRDYIPRVLAFTTLYDWRLGQGVTRISERMPPIVNPPPALARAGGTTEVVCGLSP